MTTAAPVPAFRACRLSSCVAPKPGFTNRASVLGLRLGRDLCARQAGGFLEIISAVASTAACIADLALTARP
ncbi:MAG: hypothetical protein R3D69_07875 [Xanthobacteraceae bacterium]